MAIGEKKDMISVTTLVSARTHEGVVEFQWGEKRAQLSVQEAREHALGVIEGAEAAETDAFMVEFFTGELGVELEQAVMLLQRFRSYRERRAKEKRQ